MFSLGEPKLQTTSLYDGATCTFILEQSLSSGNLKLPLSTEEISVSSANDTLTRVHRSVYKQFRVIQYLLGKTEASK